MGNVRFGNTDDIIEVRIRDSSGALIESWKINAQDKSLFEKMVSILRRKYGSDNLEFKETNWLSTESEFLKF